LYGEWRRGRGEGKIRRGEEGNGRDRPPFCKFMDPPLINNLALLGIMYTEGFLA